MRILYRVSLAIAVVLLYGGCKHDSSPGPAPAEVKAFETAAPEVKQVWQAALDADRTNGYGKGLSLYYSLLSENLTHQQRDAVARLSTNLKQRMSDAAEKGDPTAQSALQELRRRVPNR